MRPKAGQHRKGGNIIELGNVSFQEAGLSNQSFKLSLSKPPGKILNTTISGKLQAGPLATLTMCSFFEKELEQASNLPLPVVPGAHRDLTLLLLPLILSTNQHYYIEKELEQDGNLPLPVVPGADRNLTLLLFPLILSKESILLLS